MSTKRVIKRPGMQLVKRRGKQQGDRLVTKPARSPKPKTDAPAAYRYYLKVALELPGTEESTSYGTPSVKVGGKVLSRLRTEAEGALALHCDLIDREMLLQADPEVFFITDHYRNYPMILIRLDKIRRDALPELVERAWRMRAPAKWVKAFGLK